MEKVMLIRIRDDLYINPNNISYVKYNPLYVRYGMFEITVIGADDAFVVDEDYTEDVLKALGIQITHDERKRLEDKAHKRQEMLKNRR